jgi:hypothetical protein
MAKTTQNYVSEEFDSKRFIRIVLWFIGGALLFSVLCCVCTLVVGWYAGDFFVDFFTSMVR